MAIIFYDSSKRISSPRGYSNLVADIFFKKPCKSQETLLRDGLIAHNDILILGDHKLHKVLINLDKIVI